MSVERHLLNDGIGLLYIYKGAVRSEDDRRADELMDERYDRSTARFSIMDNTRVTENLMTSEEIRMAAEWCIGLSERLPRFIVAVVAPDDLGFGLGRMWQTLSDKTSWSIKIFRDMSAAEEWVHQEYRDVFDEPLGEIRQTGVLVPEIGADV